MPRLDAGIREEAIRRYVAGESSPTIAKDLGISRSSVTVWLQERGVPSRSMRRPRLLPVAEPPVISAQHYALEEWRPVVGYEGLYEISSLGRVRSLTRVVTCGHSSRMAFGKMLSKRRDPNGYMIASLSNNGERKTWPVHVLVLTAFVGPRRLGMNGCHGPGGILDNRVTNLRWGTQAENIWEAVINGTHSSVGGRREWVVVDPTAHSA